MKKLYAPLAVFGIFIFFFTACGEDIEKTAATRLATARQCLDAGQYAEAKLHIDSIRILYPKAFETRKAGITLLREVEMAETSRTYAYTDSLRQLALARAEELIPRFEFEKDPQYQDIGLYSCASQKIENNAQRNRLRATVDEHGRMTLTSFWRGGSYIHHKAIRVSAAGTFAETPTSSNPYESSDALAKTERCDFVLGENDGGVIDFITLHAGENIKVEFLGNKTTTISLPASDSKAIASLRELADALSTLKALDAVLDEATRKMAFLQSREQQAAKDEAQQ